MSSNPSDALLAHTLSSITSSLQLLTSLNLLSEADSSLIRSKLPSPNALSSTSSQQGQRNSSPAPSNASYGTINSNNNAPSPYPAPIYGQGNSNGSQSSFGGGGGAHRVPPPLPGRSYPGLGEARAVWDYHGGAPDDLIFKKDDVIVITEEMNPEWFKGHLSTDTSPTPRIGLFPSTYVTKLPPNSRGSAPGGGYQNDNVPYSQYNNNNSNQGYHSPSPPTQQFQQMQPYQPPPQQVYNQPQAGPVVQAAPAKPPGKWDGMGKVLATSAVGGVGFGAGSAVASSLVHSIF